jgi:hypothetical protein
MSDTIYDTDCINADGNAITDLASDAVPAHEQIFAGLSYYAHMAHGTAPTKKLAKDIIKAGLEYGKQLHAEDMEDES